MKSLFIAVIVFFSASLASADIIIKSDGSVGCTGGCTISTGGGSLVVCQGGRCVSLPLPKQTA